MRFSPILSVLGFIILATGVAELTALPISIYYGETDFSAILVSSAVAILAGLILFFGFRQAQSEPIRAREGFAGVALSWIAASAFGSLPYILSGVLPHFTDAFFETISGFSTTGASVIADVESIPHGILYWRALSNWMGGMGIIVLSLAIIPMLGIGGMQLFKAEVSGPAKDKLTPRVIETARILWIVYFVVTAAEAVLLMLGGMNLFDAVCHSFSTIATGGFSTKNASIGFFNSVYTEVVVIVFMFIGSCNFSLLYLGLRSGIREYFKDDEFVFYLLSYLAAVVFVTLIVAAGSKGGDFFMSLRASAFSVMTVFSTTGFATADFAVWPAAAQTLLLLLMILGACAGSTGGGLKQVRVLLLLKTAFNEFRKMIHPKLVSPVRINGAAVDQETLITIAGFLILYLATLFNSSVILMLTGLPPLEALSAVAACLTNEGPGLGAVGPMGNYVHLSVIAKWVLSTCMLLGRLELFTVLALLSGAFWRNK